MKIAVTSFGTEGDVRPYIALARELRSRGHDAWLVAARQFEGRATSNGVPFRDSGMRWDDTEINGLMTRVLATQNRMKQSEVLFSNSVKMLHGAVETVTEATLGAEVVVSHHVDVCGYIAARRHGAVRIAAVLGPHTIPSSHMTPWGANLGPFNRWVSAIVRRSFAATTDAGFNTLLAAAGLPAEKDIVLRTVDEAAAALIAVSPEVFPPDPRWTQPTPYHVTGFWFLDDDHAAPDPEVVAFIERHGPPVVVSFGSMVGLDTRRATEALVQGLAPLNHPVIIQAGWSNLGEGDLPPHMKRVRYVPHAWLLPRSALLIHHGGIGTVSAALRAGIPQMVVSHYADQPDWGRLVVKRGLSPDTAPFHRLKSRWLREATQRALADRALHGRCKAVGERIRAETGTLNAALVVERAAQR